MRSHHHSSYRAPSYYYYRPYYTRWYVHPYYRWSYSTTMVVAFTFAPYAWYDWWVPPVRAGWMWTPGYWSWGYWHPGYWVPVAPPPPRYVYVPGYWEREETYVEGYYRTDERDGWEWIEGYYLEDGTHVRGHWAPTDPGPEGYVWEAGFFDGETWVDGFWRPEYRRGFTWVSSYFDDDGVFRGGYWMPLEQRADHVWVPGWFDGNQWVEGYWVRNQEYMETDLDSWQPPEGWDDGWDGEPVAAPGARVVEEPDLPLALPVAPPEAQD